MALSWLRQEVAELMRRVFYYAIAWAALFLAVGVWLG